MNHLAGASVQERAVFPPTTQPERYAAHGEDPAVLADIYREDINIAIWQRTLSQTLQDAVHHCLALHYPLQCAMTVSPLTVRARLNEHLAITPLDELADSIAHLVDMFCCLFGLERAALRLMSLERAMCPKFHVDKLPCRLVTTFQGPGTQWLPQHAISRESLGYGSETGKTGPLQLTWKQSDIERLHCGDVALLKGERWEGNENAGIVHRSPAVAEGDRRLLLTLDFCQ
ncbi:MAG: DUF1826 domain-containing protein [Pseudomonadota bacterium]